MTVYTINSFGKTENGGNPAGVVLDADRLSEERMKAAARAVGFSETAFFMKSSAADYKLRFFTPTDEVDLCGHATIGAFAVLKELGLIENGRYSLETKAGLIEVVISDGSGVMMSQPKPKFYEAVDRGRIADSLGISVADMDAQLPPQIVSTGLRDIMVPIRGRELLDAIRPDFGKVTAVSRDYGTVGYHLFTRDTLYGDTAYCRNLAPLYGIPEEAATGTSSGALACYFMKHEQLRPGEERRLVFEQGYCMGRPSEIQAALSVKNGEITEVLVGGTAKGMGRTDVGGLTD